MDPLQARCYFLDLLKIPSHTFYEIGVNLPAPNSVYSLKSEDTDGQLAAEHHSAELLPTPQQFLLQRFNLMILEHINIIDWLQDNTTSTHVLQTVKLWG